MKIIQQTFTVLILASLCLNSCASAPLPPTPIRLKPPRPQPTATQTATPQPSTPTPFPSPTEAPLIFSTPLPTPTSDPLRRTPPTLMLHRPNHQFDSVQFLKEFIAVLQQNEMEVVTYRRLVKKPDLTLVKQGRLFIITIDDIYLRYPIDPHVMEMISLLVDADYPAVLGVVTESDYAYPETVETLRKLQNIGWEIASHSDTHRNLAQVEKIAPKSVYPEIKASLDKLEKAFDIRPITLILPEGQMTRGDEQIKRSGVLWVIGINGGTQYKMPDPYHYLGREGPAGTAQKTFEVMIKRFNP